MVKIISKKKYESLIKSKQELENKIKELELELKEELDLKSKQEQEKALYLMDREVDYV